MIPSPGTAELKMLAEKAARARRLADAVSDPAVRRSLVEWVSELEGKMAAIRAGEGL